MQHTINAENKKIGRIASDIAMILMGKTDPNFTKNTVSPNTVLVTNASKLSIDPRKLTEKEYERYSGYPGGFKTDTLEHLIEKKGYGEVLRNAVYGMLPANKLRGELMKQLTITE